MLLILMMTRMQLSRLKAAQPLSISPHSLRKKPENLVCFVANLISHTDWIAFSLYSVLVGSLRERANPASQFRSSSTRAVFHSEDHLLHVKVMPSLPHIIVSNASAIGRLLWVSVMPFVPVCPEVYYTESGVFIPYLSFLIIIFYCPSSQ